MLEWDNMYNMGKNIDNMFFTCCTLHNMLLSNGGFDRRWKDGCNWQGQYGDHANEDLIIFQKHARRTSDCIINGYRTKHFPLPSIRSTARIWSRGSTCAVRSFGEPAIIPGYFHKFFKHWIWHPESPSKQFQRDL